jgi:beta-glucosidase
MGQSPQHGLSAEFFANTSLSGQPVASRIDREVNFNWDKFVPVAGVGRNNYSVRWTGMFVPPAPGDYKLGVRVNYCYACENAEGFKLYLDGEVILQSTGKTPERGAVMEVPEHFDGTTPHRISLEYVHGAGSAGIDLTWEAPASVLRDEAVAAA